MSCPGSYTRAVRPKKAPKQKAIKVGEAGLVVLEYRGFQELKLYHGLATGQGYKFGMERMKGRVDSRDVKSMLEIVEDTHWVFEEE